MQRSRRRPRARWTVPLFILALAACGGGSSAPVDDDPCDFDAKDYPGIVVLPFDAYKENHASTPEDGVIPPSVLFERIHEDATTSRDFPEQFDWNTMLGLAAGGYGDARDVMRFYLTYQVTADPTCGRCVVTLDLFEGLPFDPDRPSLDFYAGTAEIGELDSDGPPTMDEAGCIREATRRAFDMLIAGGHFAEGWSTGPPAHRDD